MCVFNGDGCSRHGVRAALGLDHRGDDVEVQDSTVRRERTGRQASERCMSAKLGAQIVIESTGHFTKRTDARKHLRGTVKKVIVSAPSPEPNLTVVLV